MAVNEKNILVYENWSGEEPRKIGALFAEHTRGAEHFSFSYDEAYLKITDGRVPLDPDLDFFAGRQYVQNKPNFGVFSDSAPDRWGRTLLNRREQILAKREERKPRKLMESDYLLGVYDEARMGALRFRESEDGAFLSSDRELAVPPITSLRTLEEASREFEKDENRFDDTALKTLLRPGSSLGGARPKATVRDTDGSLWIAKFPSKHDDFNTGAWEMVAHDLAALCGLDVPEARCERFSKLGSTYLVRRFDRNQNRRIHFSSALTMLGQTDGADAESGAGYYQLADFLRAFGSRPREDLQELWSRIVFSMAISNTDDHLRNHGFLLQKKGWYLSPLYDVNPEPAGDTLSLNVTEESNEIDIDLALETAELYGWSKADAKKRADEICAIVNENWEKRAKQYDIPRAEIEAMRPAFLVAANTNV